MDGDLDVKALKGAIEKEGASWEADETAFTTMSHEEQNLLLGYTPGPEDPSLEESERIAKVNIDGVEGVADEGIGYPNSYDLRNAGGKNFITSIKDCGHINSCSTEIL